MKPGYDMRPDSRSASGRLGTLAMLALASWLAYFAVGLIGQSLHEEGAWFEFGPWFAWLAVDWIVKAGKGTQAADR